MKVIVAIDDSAYSKEILSCIEKRQWPLDVEFKVLTVIEPFDFPEEQLDELASTIEEKRKKAAEKYCSTVRTELEGTVNGARVHFEIRQGYPKSEIIDAAVEWGADKILIGAHGQRGCPYNLLGSVSRAVASHAPCTVEIIRDKTTSKRSNEDKVEAGVSEYV